MVTCVRPVRFVAKYLLAFKIVENRVENSVKEESMLSEHCSLLVEEEKMGGDCFQNRKQWKTVETSVQEE